MVENNNVATIKRVLRSSFKALNEHAELNSKDTIEAAVCKFSSANEQPKHIYSKISFDMSNSTTNPINSVSYQSETLPSFNSILETTNDNSISLDMGNEVLNGLPE